MNSRNRNDITFILLMTATCIVLVGFVVAGAVARCRGADPHEIAVVGARAGVFIGMLLIALVMVLRKARWLPSSLFFGITAAYVFFRMDHLPWETTGSRILFQSVYLVSFFMLPALFAHFWAAFPKPSLFFEEKNSRLWILYGPCLTLCVPAVAANAVFGGNPEQAVKVSGLILLQGIVLWAAYLINGILMGIRGFLRIRSRILSRRILLVGACTILAFIPFFIRGILDYLNQPLPVVNNLLMETSLFLPALALAFALDYGDDRKDGLPWLIGQMLISEKH